MNDKIKLFRGFNLDSWDVQGNEMIGEMNNFGLVISFEVIDQEKYKDIPGIYFEQDGLGFVLTIYDMNEKKKADCGFTSLQETIFFINSYLSICKTIEEVGIAYNTYRITDNVINKDGKRLGYS